MKTINAKEAQNNFGDLMNEVMKDPMVINKYGKPRAVLMSFEEYEKFAKFEDFYWLNRAQEAAEEGFLSAKESDTFITNILKG